MLEFLLEKLLSALMVAVLEVDYSKNKCNRQGCKHTSVRIFAEDHHLALVTLRSQVALEAILVSALLLAHLAIPSQLLQALGFDAISNLQKAGNIASLKTVIRSDTHTTLKDARSL